MTHIPPTKRVVVHDYNALWPTQYEELRAVIWPIVSDTAMAMEHVGSTSVPGLAAKPILDMDIIVTNQTSLERTIQALGVLGYQHRGELGIEGRHAFLNPQDVQYKHNLYVCLQGSSGLRNHLMLRDYLRAHPEFAQEYGTLKKSLATQFPNDIESYIEGKSSFIASILERCGFDQNTVNAIKKANEKKDP